MVLQMIRLEIIYYLATRDRTEIHRLGQSQTRPLSCTVHQNCIPTDVQRNGVNHAFILFLIPLRTRISFQHVRQCVSRGNSKLGIRATQKNTYYEVHIALTPYVYSIVSKFIHFLCILLKSVLSCFCHLLFLLYVLVFSERFESPFSRLIMQLKPNQ